MHEKVSCTGCHVKPVFTDVGKNCANCHADIHRGQFGANCAQCHTVLGWQVSVQSISQHFNRFPLLGAHAVVECEQCHKTAAVGNYLGLSTACESCHMTDFQKTSNPNHVSAKFSTKCETCHISVDTWLNAKFDHSSTGFLLTNGHANVPCSSCHINNNYNLTTAPTDCGNSGCHQTTWVQTNNPVHSTAGPSFALANCVQCHDTIAWTDGKFNHSTTAFPLQGAHTVPPRTCTDSGCHIGGNFAAVLPTTCYGCHTKDFNNTATVGFYADNPPNHVTANFSTTCTTCHNMSTWAGASFNHNSFFALTNAHASPPLSCVNSKCHVAGNYTTVPTACSGCHMDAYNSTVTTGGNIPNHVAANFPMDCTLCHDTIKWADATFNHSTTAFPLQGAHVALSCTTVGCHAGGNYTSLPTTCFGCHTKDFNNTATTGSYADNPPNHVASNFSTTCTLCHTQQTWTSATFNHNTFFPLTNAHMSPPLTCVNSKCHVGGNYTSVPTACSGCHLDAYNSTVSLGGNIPNHVAATFPMDCTLCHDTIAWADAVFDHSKTTFPLLGAHITVPCTSCHTGGNYTTLPTTCVPCHQAVYNSTATLVGIPNHVSANYPTTCLSCHNMTNWLGAVFNHASTRFGALTGQHALIACTQCHITAALPPLDCYSCHTAAWQSTTNMGGLVPNHVAASLISGSGFTTAACSTCHTTTNWLGATFTHSWFNQQHGNSGGVCTICHTNSNNYTVFQCTVCHGNNNAANFNHPGVGGYVYNSVNCYACHSRG
jgi:hypothetical protein